MNYSRTLQYLQYCVLRGKAIPVRKEGILPYSIRRYVYAQERSKHNDDGGSSDNSHFLL
jgi:hypothetical protein